MVNSFEFNYQEVVEALIKAQGIEEGIWALGFSIKHKAGATNDGDKVTPTVFALITGIMLFRVDKENNLSVDASKFHTIQ